MVEEAQLATKEEECDTKPEPLLETGLLLKTEPLLETESLLKTQHTEETVDPICQAMLDRVQRFVDSRPSAIRRKLLRVDKEEKKEKEEVGFLSSSSPSIYSV